MNTAMSVQSADPIPTRYSLLSRLQNRDDQESWTVFFDTYWRLIFLVAIKSGLTQAEAEDVVQETVISVARDIHKFERNRSLGSFKGWLRNITRWRIADQLRKRVPPSHPKLEAQPEDARTPELSEIPDPNEAGLETLWEEEWRANLFEAAVDRVKQRIKEEQYQMFDLYALKGWPVTRVARTLGVSVGKVYLAKHRVAALIRTEIRALNKKLF
jgi:RNA polymerase sigma-70 factor (ECF subfamily)